MDLEKINNDYVQFKKDLATLKNEKDAIGKQVNKAKNELTVLKATRDIAVIDGDDAKAKTYEAAIEQKKKDIEKIAKDLAGKTAKVIEVQRKIDEKIAEVKKDPAMKKHLDEALVKRYTRTIKKVNDEKNAVVEKKERFVKLSDLAEKHPSVKKNLIGMTNAQKEIKALKDELKKLANPPINGLVTYTDPARATEIMTKFLPIANAKYDKNKDILTKYAKTQNIELNDNDLSELTGALANNKGNIDIKGTIERQVKGYNRQIKGYNKQILNLSNAAQAIDKTAIQKTGIQIDNNDVNTIPAKTGFFGKLFAKFKNWRNKASQKSLPETGTQTTTTTAQTNTAKKKNEFAASMKYDIVKDEFEKMEKEGIKSGKQQRKEPDQDLDRD